MRQPIILCSPLLVSFALVSSANAATTMYVSPTGTATTGCTRNAPCDLGSAASTAAAGDTVILMDGIYKKRLYVKNSGTSSAWITFQADECATPIIEGTGVGPTDDNQDGGVTSAEATYVRVIGVVSRGWNTGFGNGWTGAGTTNSNGHWEFKYCVGDGNGRTGFTFFSAQGLHIQNCISAHNGSSTAHSWSSGITLYQAGGSDNLVEGTVSFENMDGEKYTDGSGFIVDEQSNGATFVNNVAFRNGGSCFRLTKSSNTRFINNTCYHNAQDTRDMGPSNPSEIYFTDAATKTGVSFMNNVLLATGTGPGAAAVYGQPTSGWSNNITGTGSATYFTAPDGTNPDFTLASSASTLIGKGATGNGVPTNDIGFDPKCIVKGGPTLVGSIAKGSWWQYSVDIEYIKKLGGVGKCFNPKARSGTPDIGAYLSGTVTTSSATCTPTVGGTTGTGGSANTGGGGGVISAGGTTGMAGGSGMAGTAGNGGMTGNAGGGAANASGMTGNAGGGAANAGGMTGNAGGGSGNAGGMVAMAGGNGSPGGSSAAAGSSTMGRGGNSAGNGGSGQTSNSGGTTFGTGGVAASLGGNSSAGTVASGNASGAPASPADAAGCGCRVSNQSSRSSSLLALGLVGLAVLRIKRRRGRG